MMQDKELLATDQILDLDETQCVNVTPPSQEGEGSSIATRGTGLYRVLPKLYNKRLCFVNQFE